METKIRVHKNSPMWFVVENATDEMITEANRLARSKRAQVNGKNVTVHVENVGTFRGLLKKIELAKPKALNPHVCEFCGAPTNEASDGSRYCSKFCN